MLKRFNQSLDDVSEYLSKRKGLIPLIGIIFVAINFILRLIPAFGWVAASDVFLHLGVILAIIGFMLAWAL
ncbi:MAG: hypothetical protein U9Q82_00650 [Chloroflexota bacterium]|nr:hypothetical protein [Chloroflexota bacterium]